MTNEERVQRLLALDEKRLLAAELAMDQLVKRLGDPKTPPTAMTNLINTALRVNGMLDPKGDPERDIEPHEMTREQIGKRISELQRASEARMLTIIDAVPVRSAISSDKNGNDVFG